MIYLSNTCVEDKNKPFSKIIYREIRVDIDLFTEWFVVVFISKSKVIDLYGFSNLDDEDEK